MTEYPFSTPAYLIDETILDEDIEFLKTSLASAWENPIFSYSVKTNPTPWLLSHLRAAGFRAEVVSETEYALAKRIGYADSDMIYNGPIKDKRIFTDILKAGGLVNLDSHEELEWLEELSDGGVCRADGRPLAVGLRVNIDFRELTPHLTSADAEGSRFGYGVASGELSHVISFIKSLEGIEICGLHLHSTTSNRAVEGYEALARLACKIKDTYHLRLTYVDMGGGYFGGVPGKTSYADYMPAIAKVLRDSFDPAKTAIAVEPGVSLISRACSLITTVKDVKAYSESETYVLIDGSRLHMNPQVTRRTYPHHFERNSDHTPVLRSQMITGFTCMEYDRLFPVENAPALLPGDRVVFDLAGGYTMALAPHFIRSVPPIYVRKEDGSFFTAREPQDETAFLSKNHWEGQDETETEGPLLSYRNV